MLGREADVCSRSTLDPCEPLDVSDLPPSDPTAARDLAGVLTPDEAVLWSGRPDERHYTRTDMRLIGLGLFWTVVAGAAFVGFVITLLSDDYDGIAFGVRVAALAMAAAPFVLVAIYCLGGHVILRRRARRNTAYAVTSSRVLSRRPALAGVAGAVTLRELPLDRVADPLVEVVRRETGHVDIHDARSVEPPLRFDTVRGAEGVAQLVRDQRSDGT